MDNLSTSTNAYIEFNRNGEIQQLAESLDNDKSNIVIISDNILYDDYKTYTNDVPLYCLLNKRDIAEKLLSFNEHSYSNNINVSLKIDANNTCGVSFSHFMNSWDVYKNNYFNSNYIFFSLPFYIEEFDYSKLIINALKRQSLCLNSPGNGYKSLLTYRNIIIQEKRTEIVDYYRTQVEITLKKYIRLKEFDMYRGKYADALTINIDKLPVCVEKLVLALNEAKKQWIDILKLHETEKTFSTKEFLLFLDSIIEKEKNIADTFSKLFRI
ncbi:MAG: hypothetical protein LBH32_08425 [Dysgonamonadaceae bacterium]|nr:hypothetical protein [Dysgonamonadaceae bacterium]